jgi:hypothetical protein
LLLHAKEVAKSTFDQDEEDWLNAAILLYQLCDSYGVLGNWLIRAKESKGEIYWIDRLDWF